mmetsp:Transcript_401/g.1032  ORF Transcript_401/g.1032 Transcript_401/m.1032 type:complete len:340 (-) Transcript_401:251-1270(-)
MYRGGGGRVRATSKALGASVLQAHDGRGVGHAAVLRVLHRRALRVFNEVYAVALVGDGEHLQQHAYGVPAADGVLGVLEVVVEGGGVLRLYELHAAAVERLDVGVARHARVAVVGLVAEAAAPVAEVAADDEEVRRVREVRREQRAELLLRLVGGGAHHDGHDGRTRRAGHAARDVRHVHLQRVLRLVHVLLQHHELARRVQLADDLLVHHQVAHGRRAALGAAQRAAREVHVVRRPEDEDALRCTVAAAPELRPQEVVGVGRRRAAVVVARMRRDERAHLPAVPVRRVGQLRRRYLEKPLQGPPQPRAVVAIPAPGVLRLPRVAAEARLLPPPREHHL